MWRRRRFHTRVCVGIKHSVGVDVLSAKVFVNRFRIKCLLHFRRYRSSHSLDDIDILMDVRYVSFVSTQTQRTQITSHLNFMNKLNGFDGPENQNHFRQSLVNVVAETAFIHVSNRPIETLQKVPNHPANRWCVCGGWVRAGVCILTIALVDETIRTAYHTHTPDGLSDTVRDGTMAYTKHEAS